MDGVPPNDSPNDAFSIGFYRHSQFVHVVLKRRASGANRGATLALAGLILNAKMPGKYEAKSQLSDMDKGRAHCWFAGSAKVLRHAASNLFGRSLFRHV